MASNGRMLAFLALLTASSVAQTLLVDLDSISLSDISGLSSGNANADVDFLLQSFKGSLPARVDLENFDNKYAHSCFLTGLDGGISRHGDAILDVTDTKATFSFGLSTGRITIQCSWRYKLGFIKFSGTVRAFTDRVSAQAKLGLNLAPGEHPVLEEFKVTELAKIKTDVSGLSILNWIGERILNRRINGARDTIIRKMEENVSEKLQKRLDKLKLPSE